MMIKNKKNKKYFCDRFNVLTLVNMKIMVFQDVMLYSLIGRYQFLEYPAASILRTEEQLFYQTTWCHIPEDCNLQNISRLKQLLFKTLQIVLCHV
jgi:hypothetical protein